MYISTVDKPILLCHNLNVPNGNYNLEVHTAVTLSTSRARQSPFATKREWRTQKKIGQSSRMYTSRSLTAILGSRCRSSLKRPSADRQRIRTKRKAFSQAFFTAEIADISFGLTSIRRIQASASLVAQTTRECAALVRIPTIFARMPWSRSS